MNKTIEYRKIPSHRGYRNHTKNFYINYFNCVVTKTGQVLFSAFNDDDVFDDILPSLDHVSVNYTKSKNKELFYTTDGKPFQKDIEDKIRKLHIETQPFRRAQLNEEDKIEEKWNLATSSLFKKKKNYLEEQGYDTTIYYNIPSKARQYLQNIDIKKDTPAIYNDKIFIEMCTTLNNEWDRYMIQDINENWNNYVKILCKYPGYMKDKCTCLRCLREATVPENKDSFLCMCGLESFVGKNTTIL